MPATPRSRTALTRGFTRTPAQLPTRTSRWGRALRCRIIPACATGASDRDVAARWGSTPHAVDRRRKRFASAGAELVGDGRPSHRADLLGGACGGSVGLRRSRRFRTRMPGTFPPVSAARPRYCSRPSTLMKTSSGCHVSPGLGLPAARRACAGPPGRAAPAADRLVGDDDPALGRELLVLAERHREAVVQPHAGGWHRPGTGDPCHDSDALPREGSSRADQPGDHPTGRPT